MQKIFIYALHNDLAFIKILSSVCKKWSEICRDNILWSTISFGNHQINPKSFVSFASKHNKLCFTKSLNLSNTNELKTEDLKIVLECTNSNLINLNISNCVKLRCESLRHVADYCPKLKHLDISAMSVSTLSESQTLTFPYMTKFSFKKKEINLQDFTYLTENLNKNLLSISLARNKCNSKVLQVLFVSTRNGRCVDKKKPSNFLCFRITVRIWKNWTCRTVIHRKSMSICWHRNVGKSITSVKWISHSATLLCIQRRLGKFGNYSNEQ
jgi:hypothetical protein